MQALVRQRATSARVPQRQHLNSVVHSRLLTLIECAKLMAIRARSTPSTEKVIFPRPRLPHASRPRRPARSVFKNVFRAFQNCASPAGRTRAALQSERVTVLRVTVLL